MGGDEFTAILYDVTKEDIQKIAENKLQEFSKPLLMDDQEISSSLSIGISLYPNDGTTTKTLMKNADTAMYYVKEHGKNNYMFYELYMQKAVAP